METNKKKLKTDSEVPIRLSIETALKSYDETASKDTIMTLVDLWRQLVVEHLKCGKLHIRIALPKIWFYAHDNDEFKFVYKALFTRKLIVDGNASDEALIVWRDLIMSDYIKSETFDENGWFNHYALVLGRGALMQFDSETNCDCGQEQSEVIADNTHFTLHTRRTLIFHVAETHRVHEECVEQILAVTEPDFESKEDAKEKATDNLCVICVDNARSVLFLPCRHLVACRACNKKLVERCCPICKKAIKRSSIVFLS